MGIPVMCCIKYFVFFITLLIAMTGVALIVTAGILLSVYHNFHIVVNEKFTALPFLILLLGILVLATALLGCCGAIKDNHCLLTVFASLLLFLLILGIVAAITTMIFQEDLKNIIRDRMKSTQKKADKDSDLKDSWDSIHMLWHCCGAESPADWGEKIPKSCCIKLKYEKDEKDEIKGEGKCEKESAYKDGCLKKLNNTAAYYTLPAVLVPVLLALFLVIFTLQLLNGLVLTNIFYNRQNHYAGFGFYFWLLGAILSFLLAHTIRKCLCENFHTTRCGY